MHSAQIQTEQWLLAGKSFEGPLSITRKPSIPPKTIRMPFRQRNERKISFSKIAMTRPISMGMGPNRMGSQARVFFIVGDIKLRMKRSLYNDSPCVTPEYKSCWDKYLFSVEVNSNLKSSFETGFGLVEELNLSKTEKFGDRQTSDGEGILFCKIDEQIFRSGRPAVRTS